eukprot:CAMPEP_0117421392 /NCGR_PEP_ID=MMETSP0758-20121206/2501_1 /TAXON_ID=63605 /ORGANISM="Percolomonas cosmopolitus, Strain AE-1 (ATCC 50343)" /LENGTH=607 /DNA_ID=CAMNT_0005203505 /DNA_START=330 /DNA_END=2149 /DNA_ORIENTATION=+
MTGPSSDYNQRGLMPRCIENIFQEIYNRPEQSITVKVAYMEIYNETCYDLLNLQNDKDLQIMEGSDGHIFVRNLTQEVVENEEQAMSLMFEGETNRAITEHKMNKQSSRSHCVFTIHFEIRSRVESQGKTILSKLNLVDLAGSERVGKTHSSGQTLTEAKYINKSLTFLEQVVVALSSPARDHIPYRQSKLTYMLKDSLGGNSVTTMIANIWGEKAQLEETLSTLKFASRMMRVKNDATINVHLSDKALLKQYEQQVRELKRELAMHDQLKGVNQVSYDPYNEQQQIELREDINRYVDGQVDELPVKNLRHIQETYGQFKVIILNLKEDLKNGKGASQGDQQNEVIEPTEESAGGKQKGKGKQLESDGFSMGAARANPAFSKKGKVPSSSTQQDDLLSARTQDEDASNDEPVDDIENPDRPPNKAQAYEHFKLTDGKESFDLLKTNLSQQKEKKSAYRKHGVEMNNQKQVIDSIKEKLDKKKLTKSFNEVQQGIVDEEEQMMYQQLTDAKNAYRAAHDERKMIKSELSYTTNLVTKIRARLVNEFDAWYAKKYEKQLKQQANSRKQSRVSKRTDVSNDDTLDDGEKFELMQKQRISANDPSSYSFFA